MAHMEPKSTPFGASSAFGADNSAFTSPPPAVEFGGDHPSYSAFGSSAPAFGAASAFGGSPIVPMPGFCLDVNHIRETLIASALAKIYAAVKTNTQTGVYDTIIPFEDMTLYATTKEELVRISGTLKDHIDRNRNQDVECTVRWLHECPGPDLGPSCTGALCKPVALQIKVHLWKKPSDA